MLKTLMGGKKTVAGVMSAFHAAILDLEKVQSEQQSEATRLQEEAASALSASEAAAAEARKAQEVRTKLLSIVGESAEFAGFMNESVAPA